MQNRTPQLEQGLFKKCIAQGLKSLHTESVPTQDEVARWMRIEFDVDIEIERNEVNGRKPPVYSGSVCSPYQDTSFNEPLEYDEMQLKCIVEGLQFVKKQRDYKDGKHKSQSQDND